MIALRSLIMMTKSQLISDELIQEVVKLGEESYYEVVLKSEKKQARALTSIYILMSEIMHRDKGNQGKVSNAIQTIEFKNDFTKSLKEF